MVVVQMLLKIMQYVGIQFIKDAENTYNEEVANSGNNSSEIELDIDEDTATLNDYPAKCTWTWEIISV